LDDPSAVATFLFTDIEGSTRLWEDAPERMRTAMARHDALARDAVERHRGEVVKKTGDGLHAAFADPLDALRASVVLQCALAALEGETGFALRARCGMHVGVFERRDDDYYGSDVNRAARIMSAAHGGQVLVSAAVAELLAGRLPDGLALRDLGIARLRDLARPEHLYQAVAPGLAADFPPLRSLEGTPNNLPYSLSSFIGRERELAEVRSMLARTRLLTLTGMGGLGKTRLSLQAAAEEMDAYRDGVWLVELAPLHDPRRVAQAVASALRVRDEPGQSILQSIERHVRDRRLLIVLDNCEHVLDECASLARRLLLAGEHVRILASSREALRVAGEATYAVPALGVPAAGTGAHAQEVARSPAAQLFLDRAMAARRTFAIDEGNAEAVATICRRLDGIPLAIELAAACVRTLSVQAVAQRLDDRFQLLSSGDRTALPRQQTLRALIDWSHELLSPAERVLLRRLAVFAGGWTLETVEATAGAAPLAPDEIVALLTRLVEKSLVEHDPPSERYRLLETVREYAEDRLAESGESAAMRQAHFDHYARLAEAARPGLVGRDQAEWLARLDAERENLIAAHEWAVRPDGDVRAGLAMLGAIKVYWISRGLLDLAVRMYQDALARPGAAARDALRCRALFELGQLLFHLAEHAQARARLDEGLAIARERADRDMVAALVLPLGGVALGQGRIEEARAYLEEAIALGIERGDPRYLVAARNGLAQLHRVEGRPDLAEPLFGEVLAAARDLGDHGSVAIALLNLAMVVTERGDLERARAMLVEVHGIAQRLRSLPIAQSVLEACAGLAAKGRDFAHAARFFGAAEAQARKTGLRRDTADEAFLSPLVRQARESLGAERFAASEAAGEALSHADAMAEVGRWLEGQAVPAPTAPA